VINKNHRTLYILEFKRSSERNEDFLRIKDHEANEQHKSIMLKKGEDGAKLE